MSGGIEMERICDGGGGGIVVVQSSSGCTALGGPTPEKAELLLMGNKVVVDASANISNNIASHSRSPHPMGVGRGHGGSPCKNMKQCSSSSGGKKQQHRRFRRQHQQAQRKQQNHHHYHNSKRIRRNTQPAPNNTNEFLMQEHDHLFHLDFENEEWEEQQQDHDKVNGGIGDLLDLNNLSTPPPHSLQLLHHPHDHHHHHSHHVIPGGGGGGKGAFYSSSEDEQDYLSREFSATYDTVNAERLSLMTKSELISEYQMLQERVETLERRLKTASGYNNNNDSNNSSKTEDEIMEDNMEPPISTTVTELCSGSPRSTIPTATTEDGGVVVGEDQEPNRIKSVRDEVLKLREENHQIKAHNKYLRRLMLRAQGKEDDIVPEDEMEADQGSTDSGCGGGGSVG